MSIVAPLLSFRQFWHCPNCGLKDSTIEARPHTRMHPCPSLYGLVAPMLPAGTKAKVEAVEREDYVGRELVQTAPQNGRPYMSVKTTRDDGEDVIVFAPTALARS